MLESWRALLCRLGYHRWRPAMQYFVVGKTVYLRERCVRWPRCSAERTRTDKNGWQRGAGS